VPIGFGNVIDQEQIMDAVQLVKTALNTCAEASHSHAIVAHRIDRELLLWQNEAQIEESLRMAGAQYITRGGASEITGDLRRYFQNSLFLTAHTVA
jgi:hypothetical protein